jgi:predicted nucleic acid-binding protein
MLDFDSYKVSMEYPSQPVKPSLDVRNMTPNKCRKLGEDLEMYEAKMVEWKKNVSLWRQAQRDMEAQFKADVLEENGLTGHPKADKVFEMAWERGDKNFSDVAFYVADLAELVL